MSRVYNSPVPQRLRIGLLVAVTLALVAGGTVIAFNGDGGSDAPNGEGDNAERVVERLGAAGIPTDTEELDALADAQGLGGAVRILAWAESAGIDPSEILAMRDGGMGWGEIRQALEAEHPGGDFHPGIGWIMRGHGIGPGGGSGNGPGGGNGWGPGGNPKGGGDDEDELGG
jgi:hypothetical protein